MEIISLKYLMNMDSTGLSLEAQLHEEMIDIYQNVGRETGYWARPYLIYYVLKLLFQKVI